MLHCYMYEGMYDTKRARRYRVITTNWKTRRACGLDQRHLEKAICCALATCHLPPTTYSLALVTRHLTLTTYSFAFVIRHLTLTAYHLAPLTRHLTLATYSLALATYHLTLVTRRLTLVTRLLTLATYPLALLTHLIPFGTHQTPFDTRHTPPTPYHSPDTGKSRRQMRKNLWERAHQMGCEHQTTRLILNSLRPAERRDEAPNMFLCYLL
ncbi:hypothetical protein PoB_002491800 [Plakobranchus ocellatus]|uniref:Uncharacterized protein n=1 Tax=Plakobranchus ocellatus TaxID=259542 RepID=A0AAV3ZVG9_9GAST|nr:hypothetical protein PoB_002491800 [Plakobranchus ocellatus]